MKSAIAQCLHQAGILTMDELITKFTKLSPMTTEEIRSMLDLTEGQGATPASWVKQVPKFIAQQNTMRCA